MKTVYEHELGGDGGKVGLYLENAMVEVKLGYPVSKLLEPVLAKLDPLGGKIKELIPGNLEDEVVDTVVAKIKAEVIKLITE